MAEGAHSTLLAEVRRAAAEAGIDALGVTDAAPLTEARQAIEERKAAGLHAGMWFTYGRPERSTTPAAILDGARSIVVCALTYEPPDSVPGATCPPHERSASATVAAYVATDAYGSLREGLSHVCDVLHRNGFRAVAVFDDNRLADRAAAARAGLGWLGRNTMLLSRELGSWTVLGSVVTTAELPVTGAMQADGCGPCRRCQSACPTGALDTAGVLDANRCLAWLIQAPGVFPPEHRIALGDRLYGCDDCQAACPVNDPAAPPGPLRGHPGGAMAEALRGSGAQAAAGRLHRHTRGERPDRAGPAGRDADVHPQRSRRVEIGDSRGGGSRSRSVDVVKMLQMTDDALMASFGHWYIPRRQPEYLRRNALLVLGNVADVGAPGVVEILRASLASPSPVVAGHAVWAARRLGRDDLVAEAQAHGLGADDPDGLIAAELSRAVPARPAG